MDKALRLWNFQDKSSELISFFDAAPLAVSLHPSGLYLLVSFGEKVMKSKLSIAVRADSALLSGNESWCSMDACQPQPIYVLAHSCAFTPARMFAMGVSCSIDAHRMEKVRLYSILMEDVRELKEFVVKHCRVVCFSGGGQYFSFSHNAQVGNLDSV